jgi:RNA polymerase sigma-70 factor (ECF subfamily)
MREQPPLRLVFAEHPAEPAPALLEACARGDRVAFGALYEATRDRVYCLALRLSGDSAEAADLTQEVFLKLLTRVAQFRGGARFTTWLHRIVVNMFLDRRRTARPLVPLAAVSAAGPCATERNASQAETARLLAAGIAGLEPTLRVPLVLRFVSGLSYEEIAAVLEVPMGTVASRLSRALRALARALPDRRFLEL